MDCRPSGRRPRRRRVLVPAGPSHWSDLLTEPTRADVVDMPEKREGCLFLLLWLGGFAGGGLYILWHIARAVWS